MLSNGATRHWQSEQQVPWLVANGNQWFGYDDAQSFRNKMQFIKSNSYGWDLN
jgi:GH18 family chitinase